MIALAKQTSLLASPWPHQLWEHNSDKVLVFQRGDLIFAFNFHPTRSFSDYQFQVPAGCYHIVLNSDDPGFGGHGRVDNAQAHFTLTPSHPDHPPHRLSLYLPNRTALVLTSAHPEIIDGPS
jgi:1,4-alpha-glucan branching enzyme